MLQLILRLTVLIASAFLAGCISEQTQHTNKSVEEIKTAIEDNEKDDYFCLGFLEARIFKYYENHNVFPDEISEQLDLLYANYEECDLEELVSYRRPDEQSYFLQYIGPDRQIDTNDDFTSYPTSDKKIRKLPIEERQPDIEWQLKSKEYKIDFYGGYLVSHLVEFWKVFGHYPDNINKINNIFTNSIFTNHIPKNQIIYQYHGSQSYTLQLPGHDKTLHTDDDVYVEPNHEEGQAGYKLLKTPGSNNS